MTNDSSRNDISSYDPWVNASPPPPDNIPPPVSSPGPSQSPSWWQPRRSLKWWGIVAGAGLVVAVGAVSGQKNASGTHSPSTLRSASPTPTDTPAPTPTPVPTPSSYTLGTGVTTTSGLSITAIAWQHVSSNNQFNTPPPGGYFSAADVKVCAGSASFHADPQEWSLVDSDASQIQASTEFDASLVDLPGPALKTTDLAAGQCLSGWIEFIVPAGTTPTEIQPTGANYYWTLS